MAVKPIPDGYRTVTPSLTVKEVGRQIEFMKKAFGAQEIMRVDGPGGAVMHAEVQIGDSRIMLTDAVRQPAQPAGLFLYVPDVDAAYRQAVAAGARSTMEPANMFWGDRFASVTDEWENQWGIATHVEDVPAEELPARAKAAMGG